MSIFSYCAKFYQIPCMADVIVTMIALIIVYFIASIQTSRSTGDVFFSN